MMLQRVGGSPGETSPALARAAKEMPRLAATILASSASFAVLTAFLYFLAGAYYEGKADTSGTGYLTLPPVNSFVYMGAEIVVGAGLLPVLLLSVFWFSQAMVSYNEVKYPRVFRTAVAKISGLSRFWEMVVSGVIVILVLVCVLSTANLTMQPGHTLTDQVCTAAIPQQHHAGLMALLTIFFTAAVPTRFHYVRARWAGWFLGGFVAVCFLYGFAWDTGRHSLLTENIPQAKISLRDTSAAEFDALVLGSDEKDLVIVTHKNNGRFEPEYLSRSQIVSFRLFGTAKLKQFICSSSPKDLQP